MCAATRTFRRSTSAAPSGIRRATRVIALALATTAVGLGSAAQAGQQSVRSDNYYAAGNRIDITTPMGGDVVVGGRQVDIQQPVSGDILAAGWRVTLAARAEDDVRIAAAEVVVNAPVSGDLTLAGGDVHLGPQASIGGRSWITGRRVRIEGVIDRELRIAGETVILAGEIRQPVSVMAETVDILPGARLLAALTYQSPQDVRIAAGAVVEGPIIFDRIPPGEARRARSFPALSGFLFAVHLFVGGLVLTWLLPRFEGATVAKLRVQPARSLLAGCSVLLATPVIALMLIITVLGLPVGLALGALYGIALVVGLVVTALFMGSAEARLLDIRPIATGTQRAMLLLAGAVTLAVLRALLGPAVVLIGIVFGLGAAALVVYDTYAGAPSVAN